jgi:hypothetical protein
VRLIAFLFALVLFGWKAAVLTALVLFAIEEL